MLLVNARLTYISRGVWNKQLPNGTAVLTMSSK